MMFQMVHISQIAILCFIFLCTAEKDIREPPSIAFVPNITDVHYYDPILQSQEPYRLPCETSGIPEPDAEWSLNDQDLDMNKHWITSGNSGTIHLNLKKNSEASGRYQCKAANRWGTALGQIHQLQEAVLNLAQYEPEVLTHNVGDSVSLTCHHSLESHPSPTFVWRFDDESDASRNKLVVSDKRVTIGLDGKLHFSNLLESDTANGDSKYKCQVENKILIKFGNSVALTINSGGTPRPRKPESLIPYPEPVIAVEGEELRLKCAFSAYPTADITWNHPVKNPGRMEIKDFKTEFYISKVTMADEGAYECTGTNSEGRNTVRIDVHVKSKPTFESGGLVPVSGIQGQSATFHCKTRAEPPAQLTWYINGEQIDPTNPGPLKSFSEDNTAFTFTDLCKDCRHRRPDLCNVQCKAENKYGVLFASAALNVLLPTEITEAPSTVELTPNQTQVTFRCLATTDPSLVLEISWWHESERQYNTTPRVSISEDSTVLKIDLMGATDEEVAGFYGEYRCEAKGLITKTDTEHSHTSANANLNGPTPPPPQNALAELWWVFIVVAVVLCLIILLTCLCMWLKRNQTIHYKVDKYERRTGLDPEKDLADMAFTDYVRPTTDPATGSREKLDDWSEMDNITPCELNGSLKNMSLHGSKHSLNSYYR